jgi:thioredoxin 1
MIELTDSDKLLMLLKQHPLVIVDFYASWCTPCKQMGQYLHKVQEVNPELPIVKIDVDDDDGREIADYFEVVSLPTVLFIKEGKIVHKVNGMDMQGMINGLKLFQS